ncbi:MAG: hypothetical protein K9N23_13415 [Akkermansiaceae bacterium]|nr:hypothetical protein [Akkermansiaceae bacterium]MCF7732683.1 hypothetical protein [Akkermansiaceae bacterium]
MKNSVFVLIPVLAILGWLGWHGTASKNAVTGNGAPTIIWQGEPPTRTVTDAEEVFKRAFWRRPSVEDEILHAERHEWSCAEGLVRWQWFLVVKASPGLLKDLRDDNSFGLVPTAAVSAVSTAPVWFAFKPAEVSEMQSPDSGLRLMFGKNDNTLYATASGHGFTKGEPEPPPSIQEAPVPGRIPTTSPPKTES